ncbi:Hypothetical protein I596_1892 [Dokdonella koreensis DS-123]|uniref:Uncharacterized protein n=1 Tax=Dokdonella koreensis DS-123 TaxID=1300342 RepID=A0A160DU19_9GAMM|nr:Hypothetical protein I596_1892 [Dokdonella koreensis DS-123]
MPAPHRVACPPETAITETFEPMAESGLDQRACRRPAARRNATAPGPHA